MKKNKIFLIFTSIIMFISILTIFPPKMVSISASIDVEDDAAFVYRVYDNYAEAIGYSEQFSVAMFRGSGFKGLKSYVNNVPVKYISGGALKDAPITQLVIPTTVIEIKTNSVLGGAFQNTKIETVSIPKNVKKLGSNSFKNCSKLKSIYFYNPDCQINGGANTICNSSDGFTGTIYGYKGSTAEDYAIENGYNFGDINDNGKILVSSIPKTIITTTKATTTTKRTTTTTTTKPTTTKQSTFTSTTKRTTTITTTTTLTTSTAVNPYPGLKYATSNGEIHIIGYTNELPSKVEIPTKIEGLPVTRIDEGTFRDCESLSSITLPDSVYYIGMSAFNNCTSLAEITIPDSVKIIDSLAFRNCTNLTSLTIPDSVTSIGNLAFFCCTGLTSINIPDSVTSIGDSTFAGCTNLTSITIPDSVTSIGINGFGGCTNLTSITLPDSITSIGSRAFTSCTNLISITIPDSVTSIGENVFYECKNLTIKGYSGSYAETYANNNKIPFESLGKASTTSTISAKEGTYNGLKYEISNGEICITGCTYKLPSKIEIPAKIEGFPVTSIGFRAFSDSTKLTEITIPDSVTSIGSHAFDGTPWLQAKRKENPLVVVNNILIDGNYCSGYVTIPDGVTSICNSAFYCVTKLTGITIPGSVASIGDYAFYGTGLTEITIPDSVTSIGSQVFYNCKNLTIKGEPGSYAETYANQNRIPFKSLENAPTTPSNANKVLYGDSNLDNQVDLSDVVLIMQSLANPNKYGLNGSDKSHLTEQGAANADVEGGNGITANDALTIQQYLLKIISKLPV